MHSATWLNRWELICLLLGFSMQIFLLAILIVKGRYSTFPWFTALIAQYLVQSCVLTMIYAYARPRIYFNVYWTGELVATLIRVGVLLELGRATALYVRWQDTRRLRALGLGLTVLIACAWLFFGGHSISNPLVRFATQFSFLSSLLTFVMAGQFACITWLFGLRIRIHAQAIGYGLMLFYASSTVGDFALLDGDASSWTVFQQALKPLYLLCLATWSYALWHPEPSRTISGPLRNLFKVRERSYAADS